MFICDPFGLVFTNGYVLGLHNYNVYNTLFKSYSWVTSNLYDQKEPSISEGSRKLFGFVESFIR